MGYTKCIGRYKGLCRTRPNGIDADCPEPSSIELTFKHILDSEDDWHHKLSEGIIFADVNYIRDLDYLKFRGIICSADAGSNRKSRFAIGQYT